MKRIRIVGGGLSGIVVANKLKTAGYSPIVFDRRQHIGGNCYDSNMYGVTVHNYGPHIFHTNDESVWNFVNQFTEFKHFKYAPKGITNLGTISLPYSLTTIEELGRELTESEIIDLIYKEYSEKQWGMPFDKISRAILSRVPVLKQEKSPSWYGNEKYQGIPSLGYTNMMTNMLDGINVNLGVDGMEEGSNWDLTIYTGQLDEYFNFCYGRLPYRSLKFEHTVNEKGLDHHAYNHCNKLVAYTREYDHSYFLNQQTEYKVITREYPTEYTGKNIPFYPIPFGDAHALADKYRKLSAKESNVIFLGRLATYKYLDMWVAIKQALDTADNILKML